MSHKIYVCLLCASFSVVGRKTEPIEIIGAIQKLEILYSYECGHPIKSAISFCTCHCIADTARENHYLSSKYQNPEHRCTKKELCFEVIDEYIIDKECRMYGICSLKFSPLNIYKYLYLEKPKTFINIKMNEDGQVIDILLPMKYKKLVYNEIEYKINCLKDSDLLPTEKGTYIIKEGVSQVITEIKNPLIFNKYKEVDTRKYCWYQLGNNKAICEEINNLNHLTNKVCKQDFNRYLPEFEHVKSLYQGDNTSKEDVFLGSTIKVDFAQLFEKTIELTYFCKNGYVKITDREYVSMFAGVYLKDKDVYLRRNDNFTKIEVVVRIVVLDEKGQEITEEKNLVEDKLNVLPMRKEFYNLSDSTVLVCMMSINDLCERLHFKNISDLELLTTTATTLASQTTSAANETEIQSSTFEVLTSNSSRYLDIYNSKNSNVAIIVEVTAPIILLVIGCVVWVVWVVWVKFCKKKKNLRNTKEQNSKEASCATFLKSKPEDETAKNSNTTEINCDELFELVHLISPNPNDQSTTEEQAPNGDSRNKEEIQRGPTEDIQSPPLMFGDSDTGNDGSEASSSSRLADTKISGNKEPRFKRRNLNDNLNFLNEAGKDSIASNSDATSEKESRNCGRTTDGAVKESPQQLFYNCLIANIIKKADNVQVGDANTQVNSAGDIKNVVADMKMHK